MLASSSDTEGFLIGLSAVIGATGSSAAAVIVAVRQGRATRAKLTERHDALEQKVEQVKEQVADAVDSHSRTLARVAQALEVGMANQSTLLHLIEERRV